MYHPYFYEKLAEARQSELRRGLQPWPDTQGDVFRATMPGRRSLMGAVRRVLLRRRGVVSAAHPRPSSL